MRGGLRERDDETLDEALAPVTAVDEALTDANLAVEGVSAD